MKTSIAVEFAQRNAGLAAHLNFGLSLYWQPFKGFGNTENVWWSIGDAGLEGPLDSLVQSSNGEPLTEKLFELLLKLQTLGKLEGEWPGPLEAQLALIELQARYDELIEEKRNIEAVTPRQPTMRKKRALLREACKRKSGVL